MPIPQDKLHGDQVSHSDIIQVEESKESKVKGNDVGKLQEKHLVDWQSDLKEQETPHWFEFVLITSDKEVMFSSALVVEQDYVKTTPVISMTFFADEGADQQAFFTFFNFPRWIMNNSRFMMKEIRYVEWTDIYECV